MDRRFFIRGAAALFAAGCGATRVDRGTLRVAAVEWHSGLNPYATPEPDIAERSWIFGDGLIGISRGQMWPRLALRVPSRSNGDIDASGTAITYRLRTGVTWHDGQPFVADDVKRIFDRLLLAHPMWRNTSPYDGIREIRTLGKHALEVRLSRPDPWFVPTFFSAYGDLPVPLIREEFLGTGAFRVRSASLDQVWFDRVKHANLDAIQLSAIPNPNSALVALQAGNVDVVLDLDRTLVNGAGLHTIGRRSGVEFVLFNTARLSLAQRRAIAGVLNVSEVARDAYRNAPTLELLPDLDIRAARSGTQGRVANVRLAFAQTPVQERVAAILASELERAGTKVEQRRWPLLAYDSALRAGNFDVAVYGGQYATLRDLETQWSCASAAPRGMGYARLCDAQLDRAIAGDDVSAASRRLSSDVAALPIAEYDDVLAVSARVRIPNRREPFSPWFADIDQWSTL